MMDDSRLRTATARLTLLMGEWNKLSDGQRDLLFCYLLGLGGALEESDKFWKLNKEMHSIKGIEV